jgi:hypothetical protein
MFTRTSPTTYQPKAATQPRAPKEKKTPRTKDPRALVQSSFIVTINTNLAIDDPDQADELGRKFQETLNEIGYQGGSCSQWGHFFKVNTKGAKYREGMEDYNANFNSFYDQDDKQGVEHWCTFLQHLHIEGAGVEWAPGTVNGKNQYLHAHIFMKIKHRTRLQVDTSYVQEYFRDKLDLPHKPYVNVKYVPDATQKIVDYVLKGDPHTRDSSAIQSKAGEFFGSG